MLLSALLREAELCGGEGLFHQEITDVVSHTDRVRAGCLFVSIPGREEEGHLRTAVEKGAACILCDRPEKAPRGTPVVVFSHPRMALSRLTDAFYRHPARGMQLVGVTGTNGKTSVSQMLYHIFNQTNRRAGIIGTLGARMPSICFSRADGMTTPEPHLLYPLLAGMRSAGAEYVVMEVSSHGLFQGRVAPLSFRAGVFTNLTPDHLDLHRTMDEYARVKSTLFRQCDTAILYGPDPHAPLMAAAAAGEVILCPKCHPVYGLSAAGEGLFTPINASLAGLTAEALGVTPEDICTALSRFPGVPGRMEEIHLADAGFRLFIDYAHTPDALCKALESARQMARRGRVILLFGCGGDRDREKRPLMGRLAASLADRIYLTNDNPRTEDPHAILASIQSGMEQSTPCTTIPDRRRAIEAAIQEAGEGDILLLCGKGHEHYQIDHNGKHPFMEEEIARDAYRKRKEL